MDLPVWVFIMMKADVSSSRECALLCAQRYAKAHGLPVPFALAAGESGKPETVSRAQSACRKTHISVSHSGEIWACAVHNHAVGLDVQIERTYRFAEIARRFFCAAEIEYFDQNPNRFFELWCAKEAMVKYHGSGIARGFSKHCVSDGEKLLDSVDGVALNQFILQKGYRACLCARKGAHFRLIHENYDEKGTPVCKIM